jgi:8-oxoguanine deaminase
MPTLLHAGTVVTPVGDAVRVLPAHSIAFEQGRVVALAPAADFAARVARGEFNPVISAARHIVTPGFVNTHHHLLQSLTRCLPAVQNARLFDWLLGLYERWRQLDARAVQLAAQVSLGELLRHGATTTSDHFYMFPPGRDVRVEAVLAAADALGVRLHLCRGGMSMGQSAGGLPPDDCVEREADVLADSIRVLDAFHDPAPYALRRIDLAPCSPFNVSEELLRDTRVLARERGVLLHTHLAETREEEAFCLQRFGRRPLQYLADLDLLGPDVYLAHCVWLNDGEIDLLARTGTAVSTCPVSNLRLGSGLPPLTRMRAANLRLGLGVDGSSSNDGGNILATAKQALLVSRVLTDGALLPPADAFFMATAGGARCLNRPELGHLNPGAAADIAVFAMDDLALAGAAAQDPLAALILCDAPPAARVFVAGREVVRDGRVCALDEHALGREFNELVAARFAS